MKNTKKDERYKNGFKLQVSSCELRKDKDKLQVARCELQVKIKIQNAKKNAGCRESTSLPVENKYKIIQLTNPPIYQLTN